MGRMEAGLFIRSRSSNNEQIAQERPKQAKLPRNQNIKTCLVEHEKHDFEYLYHGTESLEEITGGSDEYREIDLSVD